MIQNKILYLSDRMLLTDNRIPEALFLEMRDKGLITPDMKEIKFCGIVSYSDGLATFLPRNNEGSQLCQQQAGHNLLRALLRYYKDKETGLYSQDEGTQLIGGNSLSIVILLLDDYQKNGLYTHRIRESKINTGKVNWSRTISRSTSYPTKNGSIYLELHSTRSKYITNCEIAKIHASVIKNIIDKYGMIWMESTCHIDKVLAQFPKPSGNKEIQIAYLQRELQLSYSERDMFLIKSLINYLSEHRGKESSSILIGVRKFHGLWEAMLDACLDGKYPINHKLPIPVYQTTEDKFAPVAQKGQRTDTVLKHNKKCRFAVIDAKYYRATSPNTAPGWHDLVKQFFYKEAIQEIESDIAIITNHFIFPGTEKRLKAAYVANRNIMISSSKDCLVQYQPIYCHYQDPLELLQAYVDGNKLSKIMLEIFPDL